MFDNTVSTPLAHKHQQAGAQMARFLGVNMPLHYGDPLAEHIAVRADAGLMDANHRCEVRVEGADALANLQNLLCSDVRTLEVGTCCRSLMLNPQGGVMDDVQLYRTAESSYLLAMHVVNADKDLRHIRRQHFGDVTVTGPDALCRFALHGPRAQQRLSALAQQLPGAMGSFVYTTVGGVPCRVVRSGLAGEDGYGLCCAAQDGEKLFDALRSCGAALCGMQSFNTLRVEAGHSLYGREMDDAISPLETGFKQLVHMNKRSFVGRDALVAAGEPRRARIGLEVLEGVAPSGAPVMHRDKQVGYVTSGAWCAYQERSLAIALVETPYQDIGRKLRVDADGLLLPVRVVELPFYSRD